MGIHLIWCCDSSRQYETQWIHFLLSPLISRITSCNMIDTLTLDSFDNEIPVIVESGILRLHVNPSSELLDRQFKRRLRLIKLLSLNGFFGVIHLSDEEGLDAESWYKYLPNDIPIWRNFYHPRLFSFSHHIFSFPIGPRSVFITKFSDRFVAQSSSSRLYPWSFMGTLWSSGSRSLAVSLYLRSLPNGSFHGSRSFGQGLPLDVYRSVMLNSIFSLSPEGDRHLDTFRLWESLFCGCIPIIVDHNNTACHLLSLSFPVPIFLTWRDSQEFVLSLLHNPRELDILQSATLTWLSSNIKSLQSGLRTSFLN